MYSSGADVASRGLHDLLLHAGVVRLLEASIRLNDADLAWEELTHEHIPLQVLAIRSWFPPPGRNPWVRILLSI